MMLFEYQELAGICDKSHLFLKTSVRLLLLPDNVLSQENYHLWMLFDHMASDPGINIFHSLSITQAPIDVHTFSYDYIY